MDTLLLIILYSSFIFSFVENLDLNRIILCAIFCSHSQELQKIPKDMLDIK